MNKRMIGLMVVIVMMIAIVPAVMGRSPEVGDTLTINGVKLAYSTDPAGSQIVYKEDGTRYLPTDFVTKDSRKVHYNKNTERYEYSDTGLPYDSSPGSSSLTDISKMVTDHFELQTRTGNSPLGDGLDIPMATEDYRYKKLLETPSVKKAMAAGIPEDEALSTGPTIVDKVIADRKAMLDTAKARGITIQNPEKLTTDELRTQVERGRLEKVAKEFGVEVKPGMTNDQIHKKIVESMGDLKSAEDKYRVTGPEAAQALTLKGEDAVKWAEGQYDRRAARKELAAMQARGEITQAQYEKFENDPRSFLKNRGEAELALATGEITKTEYTKIMSNPAELDAWIAKRPQIPTADRNLIEDAAEKGHITETQYREFLTDLTKRTAWLNTYKDNFKKESLEQVKGLDDAKQKGLITDAQYREMINDPTKRKSWYEGTWKKQEEEFKKWEEAGVKPDLSKALTQITPPKDDKTKAGQTAEVEGNTWIFDSAGKATVCLSCEREYPPNAVPPVMGKPTEGDVLTGADGKSQWYYHDKEWRYVATTEKEQRMSPFNKEELADFKKDWTDEDKARGWREVESGDRGYDKKTPEKWAYNEEGKPMFCYKNCLDASEGPTSAKEPPAGLDPTKLKVGQEQTSSGLTWRWDGTTWVCTDAKCPVKKDAYDPKKVKEIMDKSRKEYETWEPVIKEAKRYGGLDKKQFDELVKDRKLEDLKTITNFGKKVETIGLKPQEVATYCDTKTAQCTKAELGINTDPAKGGEIIYKATVAGKEVTPWSGFYCPSCIQETKDKSGDTAGKVCANAKTGGCTEAEMFAEGQVVFKGTEENPYVSEGWKPYTIEGSKEKTEYQTIQACRDAAGTKDKGKCKGGPEGYKQVHYYWSPGTITDFLQGGPATNIMRGFGTLFPKWQDPFGWGSKLDTYFNLETILISRPCLAAHGQEGKVGISPAASGIPTVTIQAVKTKVQPCEGLSGAPKAACMEENGLTGSRSYYWQYRITGKVVPKDCDMEFNIQLDGTNMYNTNRELDQGEAPFDLTGANAIVTSNEDIPNNADKICVVFSEALHGCIFSNAPSNKKEICNTIFEVEDLEQELEGDESTGFYQAGSTEATVVSTAAGCSLC